MLLLSWSHFLCYFVFFFLLLLPQECNCVSIDLFYFSLNSFILFLPYISFLLPHICLLIQVSLSILFFFFFQIKLTFECFPHILLIIFLFLFFLIFNSSGTS